MHTHSIGIGWRHPHYRELLERLPVLDFLEVHPENFFHLGGASIELLRSAREHYDISLHGVGLSLGSAIGLDDWHLDQLVRLVDIIQPIRISDHAAFGRGQWRGQLVHASDLLPLPFRDDALNVLCANVQRVQDRLKRPMLIENLSSYMHPIIDLGGGDEADMPEVVFLAELARRTGCQLIVDANNLYVNALNWGEVASEEAAVASCIAWLDELPDRVVGEFHLAGHCRITDESGPNYIDDHGSEVCDAVWQIYAHAIQRFSHVATLIEWDNNLPSLGVLLGEAQKATRIAQTALVRSA